MVTWSSRAQLGAQLTTITDGTEQVLSADLDMSATFGALIEFQIDNESGTVTDALIIRVRLSQDDTNYDDLPWQSFTHLPVVVTAEQRMLVLPFGLRFVRFGFESAGSTNDYTVDVFETHITAL